MDYFRVNKEAWNKRTAIHLKSSFYDVEGFIKGNCSLNEIERTLLNSVSGKSLLHLQCHFGQDSLSWVRRGADVTGVDLSSEAIIQANKLKEQCALSAKFVCENVLNFNLDGELSYDHVFTSYGTVIWLPDLDEWANVIARSLKKGGQFTMVEFHPLHDIFEGYSYFYNPKPDIEEEGTYTENCTGELSTCVTWCHPISQVLNSLINAGLTICQFNEYDRSPYNCFDGLTKDDNGDYFQDYKGQKLPLLYSIVAEKR